MPRVIIAVWLPSTFTLTCLLLCLYSPIFLAPAIVGAADINARYKDYKRLRQLAPTLMSGVGVKNISKRYRDSACQRYACIAAIGDSAARYYYMNGYRWYHLLPDGTFSKNSPYLSIKFYKTLFRGT